MKNPMETYKLLILDEHPVIFDGIRSVISIEKRFIIKGEFLNTENLFPFLYSNNIDIIIVDISIPKLDFQEMIQQVKKLFPHIKIVVYTKKKNKNLFQIAWYLGIDAFVLKSEKISSLPAILCKILNGELYYSSEIEEFIQTISHKNLNLSDFQKLILRKLHNGQTYLEIAKSLNKSPKTIDYHLSRLRRQFNANNSLELIKILTEYKLI